MNARVHLLFATTLLGCLVATGGANDKTPAKEKVMNFQITSSAFSEGQPIPEKHTCQGKDLSPPLQWTNIPSAAKSLVLICDDPDAPVGTWVHWVLYNLPPGTVGLSEGVSSSLELPNGAKQGMNNFRRIGYGGPCPPSGNPHRYFFKLYALDKVLELKPGVTKKDLLDAMEGHVLAEAQLMGTYKRK